MSFSDRTKQGDSLLDNWRVVTLQVEITTQESADYIAKRMAEEWISSPDSECAAVEVEIVYEHEVGEL